MVDKKVYSDVVLLTMTLIITSRSLAYVSHNILYNYSLYIKQWTISHKHVNALLESNTVAHYLL
jgi:hypothetical protein